MFTIRNLATGPGNPSRSGAVTAAVVGVALATLASGALAAAPGAPITLLPPLAAQPSATVLSRENPAAARTSIRGRLDSGADLTVGGFTLRSNLLRQFYAAFGYEPIWESRKAQAQALLQAVSRAEAHGLDPRMFHIGQLGNAAALSPIDRDLLLSDAFLGYADALARGAVPIELRYDDEDLTPEPIDVAAALTEAVNSPDPAAVVEALAPRSREYLALQNALRSYRAGNPDAPAGGNERRVREITVNLERLRWLPRQLPADRVWVNVPMAWLEYYRADRPVFSTRVIVGQPSWQTPEAKTDITALVFNPPWNVPYSIAEKEILPKLARDPNYLTRHRMVLRQNGGIQQLPGGGTALGFLKFDSDNRFDVYLHDTPNKGLFKRESRFLSHGCIRVQNPRELAALMLEEPVDTVSKEIARNGTHRRMLPRPITLFLVYQTAYVGANGEVAFAPDIYSRDDRIWRLLHRTQQTPVAQQEAGPRRG